MLSVDWSSLSVDSWWSIKLEELLTVESCLDVGHMVETWFTQDGGVAKAYDFFRRPSPKKPWVNTMWKNYLQPSHAVTFWMLAQRMLPTRDRQDYLEDWMCIFCGQTEETQEHLFFRCPHIMELWWQIHGWLHMRLEMSSYRRVIRVFRQHYHGSRVLTKANHLALSSMIHYIWQARNCSFFFVKDR